MAAFVWGDGGQPTTQDALDRRRRLAEMLTKQSIDTSPVQSWTQGAARVAEAISGAFARGRADADEKATNAADAQIVSRMLGISGGDAASTAASASVPSDASAAPVGSASQAVNDTIPTYGRALLDTISGTESPGYNVAYGGQTFDSYAAHPDIRVPIASGPNAGKVSTAAGRYQMLAGTWNTQANKLGLKDFSPANQDAAAWDLAKTSYQRNTGRSLDEDLQSGDPSKVASVGSALRGVWTSLPGGIEAGTNADRFAKSYAANVGRYGSPLPAATVAAANAAQMPLANQVASLDPSAGVGGPTPAPAPADQQVAGASPQAMGAALGVPAPTGGVGNRAALVAALGSPYASDRTKQIAAMLLGKTIQDPGDAQLRQLQIAKAQRDLAAPQKQWQKLDDNTLFDPSSGETKAIGTAAPAGLFDGKSVEGQALNGLVASGALTKDQALQLGAGKTITDPATGRMIFLTPQGIFNPPAPAGTPAQPGAPPATAPSPDAPAPAVSGRIPLTDAPPPKPPTEGQGNAMTFADRMRASSDIIGKVGLNGTGFGDQIAAGIPLIGNSLVSEDYQKMDQAARDFVTAQLRRESGAAISAGEYENANKLYLPQRGDPPDVLKQKAEARQRVIDGMTRDAGPTYRPKATGAPAGAGGDVPEGTIIANAQGHRMVMRNGKWEDTQ